MFTAASSCATLAPDEDIEPLLVRAAAAALRAAELEPAQIDRVYGAAVLGKHVEPSPLYFVHHALGLRRDALVAPQATSFSAFMTSLLLAAEAVRSGAARHVLVVVGARMSPHVEPGSGYALAIADGAAAVVVGPGTRNVIVDHATDTEGALYDATTLSARRPAPGRGAITFDIAAEHLRGVHDYGIQGPAAVVLGLLRRHGIAPADVALVAHQASPVLMAHWREAIAPGEYLDTFQEHGNASVASVPLTLAARWSSITKPHVVLMSPGMGMHATAVLMRR